MSSKKRNEVLIGAFVSFGIGLFILLLFLKGSLDALFADSALVDVDFRDVQSLHEGDPVYLFGVKVGTVEGVTFVPFDVESPTRVRVTFSIPSQYRQYIRANSRVKIDKTLTGVMSVLILENDGMTLPEGARLEGSPAFDFGAVTERMNEVLAEAEKLVALIARMAKEIEMNGDLTAAVSDVAGLVREVRGEVLPLRDHLRNTLDMVQETVDENRTDLRSTLENLKETTALARSFTEKINSTPELIQRSLAEFEEVTRSLSGLILDNRTHVQTILEDLRETSANALHLTAEIKRRPWRLLYKPDQAEKGAIDLYDAAWAYNMGATELNRSVRDLAAHLKAAKEDEASRETLKDAEDRVRQSLLKHREAEDAFWARLKALD